MGYYSNVTGELHIHGAVISKETLKLLKLEDLTYWARVQPDDIEEYTLFDFNYGDSGKAYDLEDQLLKLVESFPNAVFRGEVVVQGEEPEDRWRLVFNGREVLKGTSKLVWDTETKLL